MKSSQRIRQTLARYQRKPVTQQGILGNAVGVISVPNRVDYVYVRVAGLGTIAIYNKRVPLILDLPVDIGYDPLEPKNFQVLNIHRYPQGGGRGLADVSTILHGKTHNWAGIDPVFIEKRQLMPLRPTPMGGMNVYVTREVTYYDDQAVVVTGQQLNLASYVPSTGSWLVLLYKDTDETVKVSTGGVLKDIFTLSLDDAPQVYPGTVPIALVRLYGGQTGIAEGYQDTDLIDVRPLFSPVAQTGTSGGADDYNGLVSDFNDCLTPGIYKAFSGGSIPNAPYTGGIAGTLRVYTDDDTIYDETGWCIQFFDDPPLIGDVTSYVRHKVGAGAWHPWGKVNSDTDNLTTSETDTGLRLAPDGTGGVEWAAGAAASIPDSLKTYMNMNFI